MNTYMVTLLSSFLMASSKNSVDLLLEQLETERSTFGDDAHPLPTYQQDLFRLCCNLLREEPMAQTQKSTKHCYARSRARTLLVDVFTGLGAEVFLLCTLTMSITDLSKVPQKRMLPKLREWWKAATHPNGLTQIANELCNTNSINALVSPTRKRRHSEATDITGPQRPEPDLSQIKHARLSESASLGFGQPLHGQTLNDIPHPQAGYHTQGIEKAFIFSACRC
jgi:hypothetical protein